MTSKQKILLVLALLLSAWGIPHLVRYLQNEWVIAHLPPDYYSNPNVRIDVPCPASDDALVIVAFGQSNSANYQQQYTADTSNRVYNFFAGKCYLAKDPLLGGDGSGGSIWIKLGQKLAKKSHKKVVIQSLGVGSTSVMQWSDDLDDKGVGYLLRYSISVLKPIYPNVDYFIWVQGEADVGLDPEIYQQNMRKIIDLTKRIYPTSLFGLSSTTYCMGVSDPKIAAVQKNLRNLVPDVFWLGDTDQFIGEKYRSGCHLTPQGVDAVVDEFFKHFSKLQPLTGRQNLPHVKCCAE